MANCPNIHSPEWKALVEGLGELDAYKFFIANDSIMPPMEEVEYFLVTNAALTAEVDDTPIKFSNEYTVEEVLVKLANNEEGNLSPRFVRLARRLLPLIHDEIKVKIVPESESYKMRVSDEVALARGITTGGFIPVGNYNHGTREIHIVAKKDVEEVAETALHEILHSISVEMINQSTTNVKELQDLYNHFKEIAPEGIYAFSNLEEFMVGIFTSPKLIKFLKEQPATEEKKFTNLWDEFLDILTRMFTKGLGRDPKISKSALAQGMDIGVRILEDNKAFESKEDEASLRTKGVPEVSAPPEDLFASPGKTNEVQEVMQETPELLKLGTEKEYREYLNTIFPESKVRGFMYHFTTEANKKSILDSEFKINKPLESDLSFSINSSWKEKGDYATRTETIYAILNIKNPAGHDRYSLSEARKKDNTVDGGINIKTSDTHIATVVFNPNQVYIAGSKADIAGFKAHQAKKLAKEAAPISKPAPLKKQLGLHRKEVSYQQRVNALARLKKFNQINGTAHSIEFKKVGQADLYTYVITENNQGKLFQFTEQSKKAANKQLNERLISLLAELGVSVESLDSLIEHTGYDAVSVADMLDKVVRIAKGKEDITTLPEEFSHFFMEALGDEHPLIKMMLKAIDERYIEILGKDYDTYFSAYGGDINKLKKEAAGKLLGQHIIKKYEQEGDLAVVKILRKIVNKVLAIFKPLHEKVFQAEVEKIFGSTAVSILSGELKGNMETLAKTKETKFFNLSEDDLSPMQKSLQTALRAINKKMRIYRGRGKQDFVGADRKLYYELQKKFEANSSELGVIQFLQTMAKEMKVIEAEIQEAREIMAGDDEMYSMSHITGKLRELKTYALAYKPIIEMLTSELRGELYTSGDAANIEVIDVSMADLSRLTNVEKGILEFAEEMQKSIGRVEASYYEMGVPIFAKFLQPFAGDQYDEKQLTKSLQFAERDIGFFERWLDAMAESSDDVLKLVDEAVADTKEGARIKSIQDQKILKDALKALEDSGEQEVDWIYERHEDGGLTGNLISDHNWGEYDKDKAEFFDKMEKKYGLPTNPNTGRVIPFDFLNADELAAWYKGAKNLDVVKEAELAMADENFADDNLFLSRLKEELDRKYDSDVGGWYSEHSEARPDAKEIMAKKKEELTAEQYEAWVKRNMFTTYLGVEVFRTELAQPSTEKYGQPLDLTEAQETFFNVIREMKDKLDALLPGKFQREFMAPQIRKDLVERLKSAKTLKDVQEIQKEVGDAFRVREDEAERGAQLEQQKVLTDEEGNPISFLPVLYINEVKDKKSLSTDIVATMSMFSAMAHDYHDMNMIIDVLEMGKDMIGKRTIGEMDSSGKGVGEVLGSAAKRMENLVARSDKAGGKAYERLTDYYDMVIYGQLKRNEGKWTIPILGIEVDKAKVIDTLGRFVSIHGLAFNVYAGLQNPILGNILIRQEAIAGEYYDHKDVLWADKTYATELPGVLGEVGLRDQKNKMTLWAEKADTMQSFSSDLREIDTTRKTRAGKLFNLSALFFINHAGEHQMQLRTSLAIANTIKVKDEQGNVMNLYEAHEVVGNKLVIKKELRYAGGERDGQLFIERDFNEYVRKQNFVNKRLHGIYNQRDRAAMQRYALGRLAIMFRKWMKPGFNRRFQKGRYNFEGQVHTEGFYTTTLHFIGQLLNDLKKGQFLAKAHWGELKPHQKANMMRMMSESAYLIAAITLAHILTNLADDDDENWALNMAAYQVNRLVTELAVYVPLMGTSEMLRIAQSPVPAMNQIESLVTWFKFWQWNDVYERGWYKGRTKLYKRTTKLVPVYHHIEGLLHPEDKLIFFAGD